MAEVLGYPMEDTQSASQSLSPESLPVWILMLTNAGENTVSLCYNFIVNTGQHANVPLADAIFAYLINNEFRSATQ